jgi:hypothetical protein
MTSSLEQNGSALVEERLHQGVHFLLEQRFSARDLHEPAAVPLDLRHDIVDGALRPLVEGICRVAPGATQIAGGQADEYARPSGISGFTLDRIEDLVDGQQSFLLSLLK